jgi:hypothetical protein
MSTDLVVIAKFDPDGADKHFARAKHASQLFKAIKAKIKNQADYVVWRDATVVRSRETGGPGRGKKRAAAARFVLPKSDPGQDVADRWRKASCSKVEGKTAINNHADPDAIEAG